MSLTLNLVGPLGTSLTVALTDEAEVLPTLRRFGRQGWTSGEIPAGGLVLPLAMADNFDWSLIGARAYVTSDGEKAVMYRGQSYKRRELEEVDTKKLKLPRIVKFSRGARPTDPPHLKEGDESGVQYVSLLRFSGNGRVIEAYLDPLQRSQQEQVQHAVKVPSPAADRRALMERLREACVKVGRSIADVLAELGKQAWHQVDELTLVRTVLRLEEQQ